MRLLLIFEVFFFLWSPCFFQVAFLCLLNLVSFFTSEAFSRFQVIPGIFKSIGESPAVLVLQSCHKKTPKTG